VTPERARKKDWHDPLREKTRTYDKTSHYLHSLYRIVCKTYFYFNLLIVDNNLIFNAIFFEKSGLSYFFPQKNDMFGGLYEFVSKTKKHTGYPVRFYYICTRMK